MVLWLYNVLLVVAFPVILAVLLSKARCRPGLPFRLGLRLPAEPPPTASARIWVHAVSLGEVVAVVALVKALHAKDPSRAIVVSTVTETGREAVRERLAGIATHCYAPLDYRWTIRRYLQRLRPHVYVFVETELWPNFLSVLERAQVPTLLVNGRISSRSFARQQWPIVRGVYRQLLRRITRCLMQSARDADRAIALGAPADRVQTVGNIKFDQPLPTVPTGQLEAVRHWLARQPGGPVCVAGSTHPGEEALLFTAVQQVRAAIPTLRLIIAPRHIERAEDVLQQARAMGLSAVRRTQLATATGPVDEAAWVLVLDTRGELGAVYQYADVAFVGGTLVPIGGHNLLEPAAWGKPVLFGPYTDHCLDSARVLQAGGGGVMVSDAERLAAQLTTWLSESGARAEAGQQARASVQENQGALDRCVAAIEDCLRMRQAAAEPSSAPRAGRPLDDPLRSGTGAR